jgi:hypothetical protein
MAIPITDRNPPHTAAVVRTCVIMTAAYELLDEFSAERVGPRQRRS